MALAGLAVIQAMASASSDLQPDAVARAHGDAGFLVQVLGDDRIVGVDHHADAAAMGQGRIGLDPVVALHLEVGPVGPGGDADAFLGQQRRDLVGL